MWLDLHLKKTIVFSVKIGEDFCGFRIFKDYRRLRKTDVKFFSRRMMKLKRVFQVEANRNERYFSFYKILDCPRLL